MAAHAFVACSRSLVAGDVLRAPLTDVSLVFGSGGATVLELVAAASAYACGGAFGTAAGLAPRRPLLFVCDEYMQSLSCLSWFT
jgi:hypothetical protein